MLELQILSPRGCEGGCGALRTFLSIRTSYRHQQARGGGFWKEGQFCMYTTLNHGGILPSPPPLAHSMHQYERSSCPPQPWPILRKASKVWLIGRRLLVTPWLSDALWFKT